MILESAIVLVLSFAVLAWSSDYAVKSLSRLASVAGLSEFAVSFLIIGVASVLPELSIGVTSALNGDPAFGVAILFGSNIADLTLILGIVALFAHGIRVTKSLEVPNQLLLGLVILPVMLMLDGTLSRFDGAVLMAAYFFYVARSIGGRQTAGDVLGAIARDKLEFAKHSTYSLVFVAILFLSAELVSLSGVALATKLGFPVLIMGLLLALATCVPELAFSIQAIRRGHPAMGIGDLIGNVSTDSTFSIGLVALIAPAQMHFPSALISGAWLILATGLSLWFMSTQHKLTGKEGAALVFAYAVFLALQALGAGTGLFA